MPWDAIAPVAAAFALVAVLVLYGSAHPVPRPPTAPRLTVGRLGSLLRYVALLGAGGYAVVLLVVLVFSMWLLGDPGALRSAAWGTPFLLAVATPVFAALSWLEGRLRR
ncbi:MAG TPA: DUF6256 family protein [Actinomycetota bacterium]